jgi:hypothetical protein
MKDPVMSEVSPSQVIVPNRNVSSQLPPWLQKQLDRTIAMHLEKGEIELALDLMRRLIPI